MAYEDRYKDLEQYLASGEPGVEERARNWSMAIGMQDVDRLKPSEFLLEQAKANIEGRISSEEVGKRLEEYYSQKSVREKAETDGTFEADRVADRINLLLAEKAFTFSPMELSRIHGFLFKGVLTHAGQLRTYRHQAMTGSHRICHLLREQTFSWQISPLRHRRESWYWHHAPSPAPPIRGLPAFQPRPAP